jgi:hypothetical protein
LRRIATTRDPPEEPQPLKHAANCGNRPPPDRNGNPSKQRLRARFPSAVEM